jgi:hypothetical protein
MNYEEIQEHLGETTANRLIETVILLNQASEEKRDPQHYNRALREILLTMLAFTVVNAPDDDRSHVSLTQVSDRFEEVAREMFAVRDEPGLPAPVLN